MEKFSIFTETVYKQKIEGLDLKSINQGIFKIQEEDSGVSFSNKGGWQSTGLNYPPIGDEPKNDFILPIIDTILPHVKQAFLQYGIVKEEYFIHYWLSVNRKYNYNKTHAHGDAKMSGIFYTKVPKDSGQVVFERYKENIHEFDKDNTNNFQHFYFKPEDNLFLIFPSDLRHHVEQNLTDDDDDRRVSISFNFR